METVFSWRPGVNMREYAYYGAERRFVSYDQTGFVPNLREQQAAAAAAAGVKLVRFFASHKDFSTEESVRRIELALTALDQQGIQAIVCLTDHLAESNFFVPGDDMFYQDGRLSREYWRQRGYERHYLPHIAWIAERFRRDPRIAFWELGNEFAIHPADTNDEQAFLAFVESASRLLKETSHHHVALGAINSRQLAADKGHWRGFTDQLYGVPTLDVVGVHFYAHDSEEANAHEDLAVAKRSGRPFYVGELGMVTGTGDRPGYLAAKTEEWRNNGAFSVLLWQFDAFHAPQQFPGGLGISDTCSCARRFDDFDSIVLNLRAQAVSGAEPIPCANDEGEAEFVVHDVAGVAPMADLPTGREGGGAVTPISPPTELIVLPEGDALKVRELPGTDQPILGKLAVGNVLLASAFQDFGEYRWIYHETLGPGGWSAQRRLDGSEAYLSEGSLTAESAPLSAEASAKEPALVPDAKRAPDSATSQKDDQKSTLIQPPVRYVVLPEGDALLVRKVPGGKPILGRLMAGAEILVSASQEFEGSIWLYHESLGTGGWSAERSKDGSARYLKLMRDDDRPKLSVTFVADPDDPPDVRIDALPEYGQVILSQLVVNPGLLQHFGNTRTAFNFFQDGKDWYRFSQYLHAGVDLVVRSGTPEVRAGVHGTITDPGTGKVYMPRRVLVKTDEGYLLIYGHLHDEPPLLAPGTRVNPDTVLGTIAANEELSVHGLSFTPHLHFEVRFRGFIVNPLVLMAEPVRILYDDRSTWDFCDKGGWTKWLTPYDQPVLELIPDGQIKPRGPVTLFPR